MREFFRSRFFKVIILVFALLLGFMIYAISQNGFGAVSSQIIGTVTAPFQKLSSYISETATDFFGKFVNAEEISRQNEELRQQIAELRDQLVDYGEVKRENDVLREQLGIKTADPSLELVSAAVVARDPAEQPVSYTHLIRCCLQAGFQRTTASASSCCCGFYGILPTGRT